MVQANAKQLAQVPNYLRLRLTTRASVPVILVPVPMIRVIITAGAAPTDLPITPAVALA
jgi:hypothetical protein